MDSAKWDKSHNRKPSAGTGSDAANDASDTGGFQSGIDIVDRPSNHLRYEEGSRDTGSTEEAVSD